MKLLTYITAGVCLLILAGCQTTGTQPQIGATSFESQLASARSLSDPYQADVALSKLLETPGLNDEQRAEVLFHRGSLRRQAGNHRLGAEADLEAMLTLSPTHSLASNARTELSFVRRDIGKLREQLQRLLNHAQWFDAMWVLGERDQAATRYRKSRLSPTVPQVQALKATGYICESDGEGAAVYQLGDMRADLAGLKWCKP